MNINKALIFIFQSLLIGIVVIVLVYMIIYPLIKIYESVAQNATPYNIVLLIILALCVGVCVLVFYITPLNFLARLVLRGAAMFYREFFRQGARYFTRDNKNSPFEKIVLVTISQHIDMLAFVTNISGDRYFLFIPTSRRLTAGLNIIVPKSAIHETDVTVEDFLKYIITSGAQSLPLSWPVNATD